jgi:hypothetical protein
VTREIIVYLAVDQRNTIQHLVLYAIDSTGHLYTPDAVEFTINLSEDGTEVFGADVTDYAHDVGVYPVWDPGTDLGWLVDVAVGNYEVRWTYLDIDGVTARTHTQRFRVEATGLGVPFWAYIDPKDLTDEGACPADLSNDRMISLIKRCQQYIERETRQLFRPFHTTLTIDGNQSDTLFFGMPIIGIESIKINGSTDALDQDTYKVYNSPVTETSAMGWLPEDRRHNPMIRMADSGHGESPIYWGQGGGQFFMPGKFAAGHQNQVVKGVFGYLEPDGSTPELIKYAMLRLVYANTPRLEVGANMSTSPMGPIQHETTDRHSITYGYNPKVVSSSALSTSAEVQEILRKYRAPIGIAAPSPAWSWGV